MENFSKQLLPAFGLVVVQLATGFAFMALVLVLFLTLSANMPEL